MRRASASHLFAVCFVTVFSAVVALFKDLLDLRQAAWRAHVKPTAWRVASTGPHRTRTARVRVACSECVPFC